LVKEWRVGVGKSHPLRFVPPTDLMERIRRIYVTCVCVIIAAIAWGL
jgi:hypothetical protein